MELDRPLDKKNITVKRPFSAQEAVTSDGLKSALNIKNGRKKLSLTFVRMSGIVKRYKGVLYDTQKFIKSQKPTFPEQKKEIALVNQQRTVKPRNYKNLDFS